MKNIFFPDEEVDVYDLRFVCYMIERIARHLKQPNKYVANAIGVQGLREKLSLANVLHCENPDSVAHDWIDAFGLQCGNYDVTKVDAQYTDHIPTAIQMGKVYSRLIVNTMQDEEDYAEGIIRVYNHPIANIIDDYNSSAYYESSYVQACGYNKNGF